MLENKPILRRYTFEFSCLLRTSKSAPGGVLVPGFIEGAHFYVEVDLTAADFKRFRAEPPQFSKVVEVLEDVIERRFEGCPILATPLGVDDPSIAEIEALTHGRVYLMLNLSSDMFAAKFFYLARHDEEFNVTASEVRVRRAGDDYTAIFRETEDTA